MPCRLACLGASTTEGWGAKTPYPSVLGEALGTTWSIGNYGVAGNTTADLLYRWRVQLKGKDFLWVVVQGGLNDIRSTLTPAESLANLDTIVREAGAEGARVMLMTLWPCKGGDRWSPDVERRRLEFNRLVLEYCAEGRATCLDVATQLASPLDPEMLNPCFDSGDHIHPNQQGADLLAANVEEALRH